MTNLSKPSAAAPARRISARFVRRTLIALWLLAIILAIAAFVYPVTFQLIRIVTVGGMFAVWAGAPALWPRARGVQVAASVAAIALAWFALAPGRPADRRALLAADTRALTQYDGVTYLWGGESPLGIDCSGLIRRGMIDGELSLGYRTLNAGLLRDAFWMWWHDCTADNLRHGYRGRTLPVETVKSLNSASLATLAPGDMAVTGGGSHVLAYLGHGVWIDADPKPWHVERVHVPAPRNGWFGQRAWIMRWKSLSPTS